MNFVKKSDTNFWCCHIPHKVTLNVQSKCYFGVFEHDSVHLEVGGGELEKATVSGNI